MKTQKSLSTQLEQVISDYRHQRSGEPLSPGTADGYRNAFAALCREIVKAHPGRVLKSLSDFNVEDFQDLRKSLDLRQAAGEIKTRTIRVLLMNLKGLFKAAHSQGLIPENIARGVKAPAPIKDEEYRRLSSDERDGLLGIDEKRLSSLNDEGRFLYLRDKAMIAVQYDAALRASEVARLSEKDILWSRQNPGGIVPIVIRESKDRAAGFEDTAYLTPLGCGYLKRYLDARDKYLGQKNIEAEEVLTPKSKKVVGRVIFCNKKGKALSSAVYRDQVYIPMAQEAGLPHEYVGRTHYLRHTRISEWVESGLDAKRVQKLARHMNVEETLAYYNFKEKDLLEDYGRRFGSGGPAKTLPAQAWPDKAIRLELFRHALKLSGLELDEARLEGLDAALETNLNSDSAKDLFYSVAETCAKLRIHRTQLYVGWIKAEHLHPFKIGSRTVFLKNEVTALAALFTAEEAAAILGYKDPSMISRLAAQGILPSVEIGKGRRFRAEDLTRFIIEKKNGRLRLNSKRMLSAT
jgi:site-specific recombinase XerD